MARRWTFPFLVQVFLLLAVGAPASAREWLVSPAGDDEHGDGTPAKPYRTLQRILNTSTGVVADGDTVTLRAGVYDECDVRLRKRLTLRGYPGERPHLRCDLRKPDSVVVQIDPTASGGRVAGLEISGSMYYGVKLESWWSRGSDGHGASDVVLEDLKIHDTGRDGIKLTPHCDRVTIRRSEIWNTGAADPPGTPLEQRNAEGIDNVGGAKMVVEDNHIHDIATTGLYFKGGATDVVVQRNRIENTGMGGILIGFHTDADLFDTANPDYYEAIRGIVRNNLVRNTGYAGIGLYSSRDAIVANNTIVDTARLGHAAIFFGIPMQDGFPKPRKPSAGTRIRNNLVIQGHDGGACVAIRWQPGEHTGGLRGRVAELAQRLTAEQGSGVAALEGAPDSDYNGYHADGGCRFVDERPPQPLLGGEGFETWREREGADAHSFVAELRVDASGRLPAGSPAIKR
ncbi:right-handed parallel beta-helix repeat-containing protein, partial [Dokdonella sp.]|uniref:right-handed parallel beta-helix repeat-containing protein n=1 Tax=Dokdonella sp. TaxID=2291710 RepID=UPI00261EFF4A